MNVANERVLYMYTKPNQKNKPRPGLVVTQSDETQSIKMVTKGGMGRKKRKKNLECQAAVRNASIRQIST